MQVVSAILLNAVALAVLGWCVYTFIKSVKKEIDKHNKK